MKQIFAILLLSFGVYSFAFGLYLGARSVEMQRKEEMNAIKRIVFPERVPASAAIKPGAVERYPLGFFLLSASGTTFGIWGGIHLLILDKGAKKKKKA